MELANKRIVLGLTGGIACYKMVEFVRRAQELGATIDVVMTESATQFIGTATMQAISGQHVWTNLWDKNASNNMAHINLTRNADLLLIAPASTNFIAKMAHGFGDDLLSTLYLARGRCPAIVAPAMNREMWDNPANQRNVNTLRNDGVLIAGPSSGDQACGEVGDGRMLEANELLEEVVAFFKPKVLQGKNLLITAGPTSEPIDPVRTITNKSSGKMGYAIARAAYQAGAQVTMVSGPTALDTPYGIKRINVQSALDMYDAVMSEAQSTDIFVAVAAVADWRVANYSDKKIKKTGNNPQLPTLEFEPNPDILAKVASIENAPFCVGFAAETEDLANNAKAKLKRKQIPLLIGNLVQESMNSDHTKIVIIDDTNQTEMPAQSKAAAATTIINEIAKRL